MEKLEKKVHEFFEAFAGDDAINISKFRSELTELAAAVKSDFDALNQDRNANKIYVRLF